MAPPPYTDKKDAVAPEARLYPVTRVTGVMVEINSEPEVQTNLPPGAWGGGGSC